MIEISDAERDVKIAELYLRKAQVVLHALYTMRAQETWGIHIGSVVRDTRKLRGHSRMKVGVVVELDMVHHANSKPWAKVRCYKKGDPALGLMERVTNFYSEWEIVS